ncbi:MAG: hypothetical protein ACJ79R_14005 [Anaeromyxobacteraceae bacterium]
MLARIREALAAPAASSLLAALLVAAALMDTVGEWGPAALVEVTAAAVAVILSARRARRDPPLADPARVQRQLAVFYAVVVATFVVYGAIKARHAPVVLACLAAAAATLATGLPFVRRAARWPAALRRIRLPVILACGAVIACMQVTTRPHIDVWTFQQEAASALLRGQNPYDVEYPNIFGDLQYYSPAVADAEHVHAFPYLPQTILTGLPSFVVLGDTRYGNIAGLLVSGAAIAWLAPAGLGELAAAALVLHPINWRLIRGAWTEPTVLAPALLLLLALRRFRRLAPAGWAAAGVAGALLAGSKQYSPLLLLPLLPVLPDRGGRRAVALAVALTLAVVAPFLAWNAQSFFAGVAAMQVRQPFRIDALSWQVALVRMGLGQPPSWIGFLLTAATLGFTWPRHRSLAEGLACAAAAYLVFLVTAKQAFVNYYWLANGLLLALPLLQATADRLATAPRAGPDAGSPPPPDRARCPAW